MGVQALGMGLGTLPDEIGVKPEIVTGHDFRSYSASVKLALVRGLVAAGMQGARHWAGLIADGLFRAIRARRAGVAMVTASHNDNGWTGVKMGAQRPVTFGPDEMSRLKEIVLSGAYRYAEGGNYRYVPDFGARYIADLTNRPRLKRKLKVVAACGNGTAGAFAPQVLKSSVAKSCRSIPNSTSPSRAIILIPKT